MSSVSTTKPRLYVGTYAKYNGGSIAGKWLDLDEFEDYDSFVTACKELHADEANPEYMIQDFEGFPKAFYSESGLPSEETFLFLRSLADLDDEQAEAFADFCDYEGDNVQIDDVLDRFREAYAGDESEKAFAQRMAEELGYYDAMEKAGISPAYFDEEAFARDLFIGDYYRTQKGNIFRRDV